MYKSKRYRSDNYYDSNSYEYDYGSDEVGRSKYRGSYSNTYSSSNSKQSKLYYTYTNPYFTTKTTFRPTTSYYSDRIFSYKRSVYDKYGKYSTKYHKYNKYDKYDNRETYNKYNSYNKYNTHDSYNSHDTYETYTTYDIRDTHNTHNTHDTHDTYHTNDKYHTYNKYDKYDKYGTHNGDTYDEYYDQRGYNDSNSFETKKKPIKYRKKIEITNNTNTPIASTMNKMETIAIGTNDDQYNQNFNAIESIHQLSETNSKRSKKYKLKKNNTKQTDTNDIKDIKDNIIPIWNQPTKQVNNSKNNTNVAPSFKTVSKTVKKIAKNSKTVTNEIDETDTAVAISLKIDSYKENNINLCDLKVSSINNDSNKDNLLDFDETDKLLSLGSNSIDNINDSSTNDHLNHSSDLPAVIPMAPSLISNLNNQTQIQTQNNSTTTTASNIGNITNIINIDSELNELSIKPKNMANMTDINERGSDNMIDHNYQMFESYKNSIDNEIRNLEQIRMKNTQLQAKLQECQINYQQKITSMKQTIALKEENITQLHQTKSKLINDIINEQQSKVAVQAAAAMNQLNPLNQVKHVQIQPTQRQQANTTHFMSPRAPIVTSVTVPLSAIAPIAPIAGIPARTPTQTSVQTQTQAQTSSSVQTAHVRQVAPQTQRIKQVTHSLPQAPRTAPQTVSKLPKMPKIPQKSQSTQAVESVTTNKKELIARSRSLPESYNSTEMKIDKISVKSLSDAKELNSDSKDKSEIFQLRKNLTQNETLLKERKETDIQRELSAKVKLETINKRTQLWKIVSDNMILSLTLEQLRQECEAYKMLVATQGESLKTKYKIQNEKIEKIKKLKYDIKAIKQQKSKYIMLNTNPNVNIHNSHNILNIEHTKHHNTADLVQHSGTASNMTENKQQAREEVVGPQIGSSVQNVNTSERKEESSVASTSSDDYGLKLDKLDTTAAALKEKVAKLDALNKEALDVNGNNINMIDKAIRFQLIQNVHKLLNENNQFHEQIASLRNQIDTLIEERKKLMVV